MATSYDGGGENCLCMPARDWILFAGAILFVAHMISLLNDWYWGKEAPDDDDNIANKTYYAFELLLLLCLLAVLVAAYIGADKMVVLILVIVALALDLALVIINILTIAEREFDEDIYAVNFVFCCVIIDVVCMSCLVGAAVMYSGG